VSFLGDKNYFHLGQVVPPNHGDTTIFVELVKYMNMMCMCYVEPSVRHEFTAAAVSHYQPQ